MSALLARYGLAESRAASRCVLGRGNGQLARGRRRWNGQTRKASWFKKSYDGGSGSNELPKTRTDEEREAHDKLSQFLRKSCWGLGDPVQDDAGKQRTKDKVLPLRHEDSSADDLSWSRRSKETRNRSEEEMLPPEHQKSSSEELGWSKGSEDAYWIAASEPIDEDSREDPFGERTASSQDDTADLDEAASKTIFGSEVYGSAVPVQPSWTRKEPSSRPEPLPYINYEVWLPFAIEDKDADTVARCLYSAQNCLDYDFVNGISEATFTDILHVLEPRNNIQKLSQAYTEISEHMAKQIGLIPVNKLMLEYSLLLQEIVTLRRQGGHPLTSAQYSILLHCAKDLGDSRFATKLLGELQQDGISPDVEMYNTYLGSLVWAGWNNSTARHRERVININMLRRKAKRRDMPFANYHIGSPGGIKEKAMNVLNAMLDSGLNANEETYRLIITAAAREGEIDTVQSLLRTAWGIDVQRIMELSPGHADMPKAKALPRDSQQLPTKDLLWTLGHAFSINNDIPKALRLVDYVSREYDIAIGEDTWSVLFEWTYALARPRHGTTARDDRKTGQLPRASVRTLFETMTKPPYFVEPTMSMYHRLIKSMHILEWSDKMAELMEQAKPLKTESRREMDKAWHHLRWFHLQQEKGQRYLPPPTVVRRQYETAKAIDSRNSLWMKQWVRRFLASLEDWHRSHEASQIHDFTLGTVPRVLLGWRNFAGSRVEYDLPTGVLEIELQTHEEKLRKAMHREKIWHRREEAVAQMPLLVGDGLLSSYEGDHEEGELVGATTKRLKEARQRAVGEDSLADQQWLGLKEGVQDEPHEPSSSVQYRPPRP